MTFLKNPTVKQLIVYFTILIPIAAYYLIIYLWLPGISYEPFQDRVSVAIHMDIKTFLIGLSLGLTILIGYNLLTTLGQKVLYRSRESVTLKAITDPNRDRLYLILSITFLAASILWFLLNHWQDIGCLVITGYSISLYLAAFSIMPLLLNSSKITFYQGKFKFGFKIFQGYDLSMIQMDETSGIIHFKHVNTRFLLTPPADQLQQHFEHLLKCTGKQ